MVIKWHLCHSNECFFRSFFITHFYKQLALRWTMHHNSIQSITGKNRVCISKITIFLADVSFLVKLISNHYATLSPKKLENISNFEGWNLILVVYIKKCRHAFNFEVINNTFSMYNGYSIFLCKVLVKVKVKVLAYS